MQRRHFLLGLAALAASRVGGARPRTLSPYAAAADYSARNLGRSMLVMERGKVVFEDYPQGGPGNAWELHSGTKSFWGVVACLLVEEKRLHLDETLAETLSEWKNDPRGAVTISQLLHLTSGIRGGKVGRPPDYLEALTGPLQAAPGKRFLYGPYPFQIFGELLRRKLKGRWNDPLHYLDESVFKPNSIAVGGWKRGGDGLPHLPSGARLTARDWARFGEFVRLHRARFAACFQGSSVNPRYGLTWWLNRPISPALRSALGPIQVQLRELWKQPGIPDDVVFAAGFGDQRMFVIPSREMVVVRQARSALLRSRSHYRDDEFLRLLHLT